jgi:hypothetical protein
MKQFHAKAHRIVLDEERSMFFPNSVMKRLLEKYGTAKALFEILTAMGKDGGQGFGSADLAEFLDLMAWGFLHESPDMTGAKLEEITSIGDLPALGACFGKAFSGALPEQTEGSENPKKGRR